MIQGDLNTIFEYNLRKLPKQPLFSTTPFINMKEYRLSMITGGNAVSA